MSPRYHSRQVDDIMTPQSSGMGLLDSDSVRSDDGGDQEKSQTVGTLGKHSFVDWIIFLGDLLLSLVPVFFIGKLPKELRISDERGAALLKLFSNRHRCWNLRQETNVTIRRGGWANSACLAHGLPNRICCSHG